MLYGQLRGLVEALITGNKHKAPRGPLRNLAEEILTGNKYKVR